MLTRTSFARRKILTISVLVGVVAAIIVGGFQFMVAAHKREQQLDRSIKDIRTNLESYFSDLQNTAKALQPLALSKCEDVTSELTSRAAFSVNVRAFLLIRNQNAFCSSATGVLDAPLKDLVPGLDLTKDRDMEVLPGTPMMPDKPAIAMWFKSPILDDRGVFVSINVNLTPYLISTTRQENYNGVALAVGSYAISTFSSHLINLESLTQQPVRTASIDGLPLNVLLFADKWTPQDIQLALLPGLLAGLLCGLLCAAVLRRRLRPGRDILQAIKNEQFYVVYQPVVEAGSLRMSGVEALLRWKHPTRGEIPPDTFIPLAEAQKLIVPLTLHLFRLIALDAPVLQTRLPVGAKMGVNIAPGHLHSGRFIEDIHQFSASLPAGHFSIVLEITERDMIKQTEAVKLFKWLHDDGYEIAIDDFGTGHSALIYLERFTMDYLKIDRGFVNVIDMNTVNSPVLDAVLMLAKRLNMLTVAEGVETPEQARWLREHGVHFLQGYYFSRPMTLTQFMAWQEPPFIAQLQCE
nr:cyclic di-GMP phosphodiesterase [uncultured Enterobacter sp.]